MELTEDDLRLYAIFHPFAFGKLMEMQRLGSKFVHYCSAEAAFHIIKSGKMRLRNAAVMNDFMEIEHGGACLASAWHGDEGQRFKAIVDGIFPGISGEVANLIDGWSPSAKNETFITCLSEHDPTEDGLGRLSMWRAYGGTSGVAVVLNPRVFLTPSSAVPAFTSPVAYLSEQTFKWEFSKVADNIEANVEYLRGRGKDALFDQLFQAFRLAILCTKHPGFAEEREWRIIYRPDESVSDRIKPSVELIRGVPQIVHSIPFQNFPEEGFIGAELPELIHRVIIGPTEFPTQLRFALVSLLQEHGVHDAAEKVVCSTIPLRQ